MQKIYQGLRKVLIVLTFVFGVFTAHAQELRSSPFQYLFNQLAINPAYASRLPHVGFDATYFGNFVSAEQVSRTAVINVQGATISGGLGGTLQFFKNASFGELSLRPSYAYRLFLSNGGEISFGGALGVNYFDNEEGLASNIQTDFFSFEGGAGVFYFKDNFFVGLSSMRLFEATAGLEGNNGGGVLFRENPYHLNMGWSFRLMQDVDLVPRANLRYVNVYGLPDEMGGGNLFEDLAYDLQLGAMIQELYIINLMFGKTDRDGGLGQRRFGLSASYLLGKMKLTYAFQSNTWDDNSVSLPNTHLINVSYDLAPDEIGLRTF